MDSKHFRSVVRAQSPNFYTLDIDRYNPSGSMLQSYNEGIEEHGADDLQSMADAAARFGHGEFSSPEVQSPSSRGLADHVVNRYFESTSVMSPNKTIKSHAKLPPKTKSKTATT